MGYTHHWTQLRDFAAEEFAEITQDVLAILTYAEQRHGIAICDGAASPGTRPKVTDAYIAFNGTDLGDLGHEGFAIERSRTLESWQRPDQLGWSFCKTARKPYDVAVTAVLCYLASVVRSHDVSSDGRGADFVAGLALAREALPHHANRLDIPRTILANDRWCAPWPLLHSERYAVRFCVDGHAYVLDRPTGRSLFRFVTHAEAAEWLAAHKERGAYGAALLFDATGAFDRVRIAAIAKQQDEVIEALIASAAAAPSTLDRLAQPPALVRPAEPTPLMTAEHSNQAASTDGEASC